MSPQFAEARCPKCADGGAVIREQIGRTVHSVCIHCGWCLTHGNQWKVMQLQAGAAQ